MWSARGSRCRVVPLAARLSNSKLEDVQLLPMGPNRINSQGKGGGQPYQGHVRSSECTFLCIAHRCFWNSVVLIWSFRVIKIFPHPQSIDLLLFVSSRVHTSIDVQCLRFCQLVIDNCSRLCGQLVSVRHPRVELSFESFEENIY